MLAKVPLARDYVYGRGLGHDIIERFQLGYAPEGWDNLTGFLQAQKHDLQIAQTAGLVHTGKSGDYYDVFRHRIIFPSMTSRSASSDSAGARSGTTSRSI